MNHHRMWSHDHVMRPTVLPVALLPASRRPHECPCYAPQAADWLRELRAREETSCILTFNGATTIRHVAQAFAAEAFLAAFSTDLANAVVARFAAYGWDIALQVMSDPSRIPAEPRVRVLAPPLGARTFALAPLPHSDPKACASRGRGAFRASSNSSATSWGFYVNGPWPWGRSRTSSCHRPILL